MSPARAEDHVSSYDVLVAGESLSQEQKDRIKEIRVVDHLRLPDVCTVHVAYPRGEGVDAMPFEIGKDLEVRLGSRRELAPRALFKGRVVTIEPVFGTDGCHVAIRAFDRSHALHRARRARTFQNQTSSDIVERILGEAGLRAECDPSGEPHEFLQQDNETDWELIWRLAERAGFEFVVDDQVGHFRRPTAEGAVELEWPGALRSFRPRVTAVQQVQEVTLLAHDPMTKQVIESTATRPNQIAEIGLQRASVASAFEDASVHIATEPVKSKPEGDALAQALLDKLANAYVGAEGVAAGDPRIKAGAKVKISGVGTRFSGTYRVATSTHLLRGGGAYETHFANSPSHTLLGAIDAGAPSAGFGTQLAVGIVTNNDDPEKLGRVRVKYPTLAHDVEGGWARVLTHNAGNERGILMLPEVDDEVLVAFLNGDTSVPLVLGSLFNGVDRPGDVLLQGGDSSFAVQSDHKVHLESSEDFTVKSGGALKVEVRGDAKLATDGTLDLGATRDVKIAGNGQVTIEGAATLTLKCGGSKVEISPAGVTVSGPMISLG